MTHLNTAKRILRYLKGTMDYGLLYSPSKDFKLAIVIVIGPKTLMIESVLLVLYSIWVILHLHGRSRSSQS